jgi:hypothetical protein
LASERFRRVLPVSCYTSTDDPAATEAVEEAVVNLMEAIGFDPVYEGLPQVGSWFKNLWFQAKDQVSRPEVQDRLAKVERALELKHIDNPQATVDVELSKAALNLKKMLEGSDYELVYVGSLVMLKTIAPDGTKSLVTLSLDQEQMELVKSNPKMLKEPMTFLTTLRLENITTLPQVDRPREFASLSDETLNPPPPTKRGKRRPKGEPLSEDS